MITLITAVLAATLGAGEDTPATNSQKMLNKHSIAMISTISTEKEGKAAKPYGSIMGYAVDTKGSPYVFISDLAVHTDNIKANPYSSLMIFEADKKGNVFNGSRITVEGKFVMVKDEKEIARLRTAYLKKHPDSKIFIDFGDFNYFRMEISSIYYIGGFGDIEYVDLKEYKALFKSK